MTSTPISAALAALRLSQLSSGRQGSFTGSVSGRQGSFTGSGLAAGSPLQPGSPQSPEADASPADDTAAAASRRSLLARQDSPVLLGTDSRSIIRCDRGHRLPSLPPVSCSTISSMQAPHRPR